MARKSLKKRPKQVTRAAKSHNGTEPDLETLDSEIDAFIKKVHGTIQEARSKMSDEEVEKADKEADAILKAASDAAKSSRHSA